MTRYDPIAVCVVLALAWANAGVVRAEDEEPAPPRGADFGGPTSVPKQIVEDAAPVGPVFRANTLRRPLRPCYAWKDSRSTRHGLQLAADCTLLVQHLTESLGERDAAAGMARIYETWEPPGRGWPKCGAFAARNCRQMTGRGPPVDC